MGKLITKDVRKTFKIRPSGRSTDFISPSFGYGCLYNCSYCYLKRHKDKGLSIAVNTGDILTEILAVTKILRCMLNIMIGKEYSSSLEIIL